MDTNVENSGNTGPFSDMKYEQNRLISFTSGLWRESRGNSRELAKAGFFYRDKKLNCYVCNLGLETWKLGDVPMDVHRQRNPNCSFVKGTADNVPYVPISRSAAGTSGRIPESARNGHMAADQARQGASEPSANGHNVAHQPVQNSFGGVPEHLRNGHQAQQNQVEPMDDGRAEVGRPSANPSSSGNTGNNGSSSSTGPRRPPQEYTGQARLEVLRKLKREAVRLQTFRNWSSTAIQPNVLAKAGLFYYNDGDKVQCGFCLGILGDWVPTDDPVLEHRRHFPTCRFMLGLDVGNVPIDSVTRRESSIQPQIDGGVDITGVRPEVRRNAEPERGMSTHVHLNTGFELDELGIEPFMAPAKPGFLTMDARFKTFENWPRGLSQRPMKLAEAGFYYTGASDEVKCFHCDGGLRGWLPGDDPWEEHAKWFPRCKHVILLRGKKYIKEVVQNHVKILICTKARAEMYMTKEPAISALEMGLVHADIKKVILNRLEKEGTVFPDLNTLVNAVVALNTRAREGSVNGASTVEERSENSGSGSMSMASSPEIEGQESVSPEVSVSQESGVFEGASAAVAAPPAPAPAAAANVVPDAAEAGGNGDRDERMYLLCKICLENRVSVVTLPCAHLSSCADCTSSLRACPICRNPIKGYVRAFLS